MGAVYKAWDKELDIPVALKVIRPEVAQDPALAEQLDRRFKRELLLARKVTHKNVVRIHDLGEIDGVKYITMTYIEGEDLLDILKRDGTVSVPDALKILRPVVSGLVAAHEAGVVHRDLKPANIMVEPATGESYIMDFGIARSATPAGVEVAEGLVDAKTQEEDGHHRGDPGRAPWSAPSSTWRRSSSSARAIDQRADIYSLGLIFYDMLVGRRRIERAESAFAEFRGRVENAPPAPRSLDPDDPRAGGPDRYPLSRTRPGDTLSDTPPSSRPTSIVSTTRASRCRSRRILTRKLMAAAAALVVVLLGGTWWLASLRGPAGEPDPDVGPGGGLQQPDRRRFVRRRPRTGAGDRHGGRRLHQRDASGGCAPDRRPDQLGQPARREHGPAGVAPRGRQCHPRRRHRTAMGRSTSSRCRALDPGLEPGEGKPLATARATADTKDEVLAAVGKIAAELRGDLGDTDAEERSAGGRRDLHRGLARGHAGLCTGPGADRAGAVRRGSRAV